MDAMEKKAKKPKRHQHKQSGPKAEKKKVKKQESATENEGRRNPKAFAVQSAVRMAKTFHRSGLTRGVFITHRRYMQRSLRVLLFSGLKTSKPKSITSLEWTAVLLNLPQCWSLWLDPPKLERVPSSVAWSKTLLDRSLGRYVALSLLSQVNTIALD